MGGKGGGSDPFPGNIQEAMVMMQMQQDALDRAMQQNAAFNFFDRVSPFGETRFEGTPGTPGFTQREVLAPAEQQALDQSRQMRLAFQGLGQEQLGNLGGMFSQPLLGGQALTDSAAELEQATFDRAMNLLRPEQELQRQQFGSQMSALGLPSGSQAFETASDRLARQQQQQQENLALSAVGAGRQEQSRLLQADAFRRQSQLDELASLGFGGPQSFGNRISAPQLQTQAVDVNAPFQMMNQNVANQNQMAADKKSGTSGAIGTIGSAALMAGMMSTREAKTPAKPTKPVLGPLLMLEIGEWRYKPEVHIGGRPDFAKHIGPMAEDFNAAFGFGKGPIIKNVDAMGVALKAVQELAVHVFTLTEAVERIEAKLAAPAAPALQEVGR